MLPIKRAYRHWSFTSLSGQLNRFKSFFWLSKRLVWPARNVWISGITSLELNHIMAFEWIESHGSNQKARLERFESHGSNHMTQKAQFASNRLNRLNRFDLRPDIGPEITLKHFLNNSKYVHFVSPGHHFVLVAGDLESFATFLQPHDCDVGEANLICGCKYLRHGRTAGELGGLTGSGGQLVVGRLGVMTS